MTLTALRLANFKAFGASQRIPLRPITLIFGANSAGKSSLIHALALAHHAVETGELDTQRTQIGGEAIDLGGFRQYVHRRNRTQQVEMAFEIEPGRLTGRVAELLRSARGAVVEVAIGAGFGSEQKSLFGDVARELDREGGVRVERFAIEVDGAPLLSMSARPGGVLRLDRLDHRHPVFREVFRGIITLATTTHDVREEDYVGLGEVLDALVPGITARPRGLFPRIIHQSEAPEALTSAAFLAVSRGRRQEDLALATRMFLPEALRDLVDGLATAVESEIRTLRYLGPLRSYPPRHLAFSQHHDPNWFAGGGYAWDVVRTNGNIRSKVNAWLGDPSRLKTPYEIVVRELLPAAAVANELPPKIGEAFYHLLGTVLTIHTDDFNDLESVSQEIVERIRQNTQEETDDRIVELDELVSEGPDTDALAQQWSRELVEARVESLQDMVLIDKRTNTPVSHRDVGIGVSQVLPVLVSAYASEAKLLAIEQPEIHLHPALQAELGDVFIDSALGPCRNTCLIETHSEHLLLRIMRRIRETSEGKLPSGRHEIRPDDVMVVFVEPDGPQSIVREMPLNERGELVKAWPGGFFEEGLREIF